MHERQILETIDKITLNTLSDEERSILVAFVANDLENKRVAGSINQIIMTRLNEMKTGNMKIAEAEPKIFQDFSETKAYPAPNVIVNKDEIDAFLEKMTSKEFDGNYFDDTFDFYHPTENMTAKGQPRHRSDFNQK